MADILQQVKDALSKAIIEKKLTQDLLNNLGPAVVDVLRPMLGEIADNSRISKDEILSALSELKIDVPKIDVPHATVEVKIPEIKVPTPQVTVNVADIKPPIIPEIKIPKIVVPKPEVTVNVPAFPKIPALQWPSEAMPIDGWVRLQGVDITHPLPVQLRDAKGNVVDLSAGSSQALGGAISSRQVKVTGMPASSGVVLLNPDGNPTSISATITGGGSSVSLVNADGTYYDSANPLPVTFSAASIQPVSQVSGHEWSVSVNDIFRTTVASSLINSDDRLRVSLETGGSGLTDAELRAVAVPVNQLTGSNWSVFATNPVDQGDAATALRVVIAGNSSASVTATQGTSPWVVSATDLDIRDLVNATDSVAAYQVSGATWSVSVNDIFRTTVASNLINSDDRLRVSLETGGSGLTDTELRATAVPTSQVSGATWSVSVNDIFRTTVASNLINSDDRLRVSLETGGSGLTDAELRASSVPVAQASGANFSVEVTNLFASQAGYGGGEGIAQALRVVLASDSVSSVSVTNADLDVRDLVNATDSVSAYQVSGATWSVSVNDMFRTTVASNLINADDRLRVSLETGGSGLTDAELRASAVPVMQVSGANWSVEVKGGVTSSVAVGPTAADTADDGNPPIQTGGIARTANPTAVAANDVVKSSYDVVGRQITRPVQMRGLLSTAYATMTTGTATTLLQSASSTYNDLVYLVGANTSDVAVTVNVSPGSAEGTVLTLQIPANGTAGIACPIPFPQGTAANAWTVDMGDITGTTVYISALFSQEV